MMDNKDESADRGLINTKEQELVNSNMSNNQSSQTKNKKKSKKMKWIILSIIIVIAVTLAIVLPMVLKGTESPVPSVPEHYNPYNIDKTKDLKIQTSGVEGVIRAPSYSATLHLQALNR